MRQWLASLRGQTPPVPVSDEAAASSCRDIQWPRIRLIANRVARARAPAPHIVHGSSRMRAHAHAAGLGHACLSLRVTVNGFSFPIVPFPQKLKHIILKSVILQVTFDWTRLVPVPAVNFFSRVVKSILGTVKGQVMRKVGSVKTVKGPGYEELPFVKSTRFDQSTMNTT